ncbi:hypothetical protein [Providencia phage PSTNGR1]|uniref:Uncharacterized protein n=1 Tax=Providencia phage PSTNGR1 TaxID=2783542 RepID=A0A873WFR4_9CAUD|nr:hypothetical protein [Providencia phage PSTNGR1]
MGIKSEAVIKNDLTAAEQEAATNPSNPGAEPAVQAIENERSYARTRQGRIEGYEKKIAELQAKLEELRNAPEPKAKAQRVEVQVEVGSKYDFEYGRGDSKTVFNGTVLAVFEKNGARKVKFLTGEGADAQVLEVFGTAVKGNEPLVDIEQDPLASVEV